MEGITHRTVAVNGINMHVAEKGEGPVVVLLHGFPELWYSWRHQIVGLADRGYRAVAPDLRGYGDSDVPSSISSYTILHLVGDIVALIDTLGQDQVFVVGHDWGALVAWYLCLLKPEKVKALVNLSVPFRLWDHNRKPVEFFRSMVGDDFYLCRFQVGEVSKITCKPDYAYGAAGSPPEIHQVQLLFLRWSCLHADLGKAQLLEMLLKKKLGWNGLGGVYPLPDK